MFFIPYLIASVVNAQVWKNLLDPTGGLAVALDKIGIHWLDNVYFFGDSNLSLYSVAFVDNWQFWGFLVVLFLAAMQAVDGSQFEAARLDGANAWQEFWHVTLPGIRPTLDVRADHHLALVAARVRLRLRAHRRRAPPGRATWSRCSSTGPPSNRSKRAMPRSSRSP